MSRISVSYRVPVQVHVDLDTGEVERVTIFGELIEQDRRGATSFFEDLDTGQQPTPQQIKQAYDIAERAEWPVWEHE